MMKVLLTGANGFVGKRILDNISRNSGIEHRAVYRRKERTSDSEVVEVQTLDADTNWSEAVAGQQVVIHAAARVHVMNDSTLNPLSEYRRVNTEGTLNLARYAAVAGVKRFIFISSIKVNGEETSNGRFFTEKGKPAPDDAYGISKLEAEKGLMGIAEETGMEVVIVRPPLVYGPGVKGNFASMIKLVELGLPLPLGAIQNKRSLVAVDNLVDLIVTCIDHPAAANQVFLVGDGHDLSTTELLRSVAKAIGKPSRLIPVPQSMLMFGARLVGKGDVAQRLLGSLQVDISKARTLLGWEPPVTVDEGLRRCFKF
jgi:nucleoside-diphosphate-sugar epimerase